MGYSKSRNGEMRNEKLETWLLGNLVTLQLLYYFLSCKGRARLCYSGIILLVANNIMYELFKTVQP